VALRARNVFSRELSHRRHTAALCEATANPIPENRYSIPKIGKSFLTLLDTPSRLAELLQVYFQRIQAFISWGTARRVGQRLTR
jgi:hypothetical protein